MDNKKKIMEKIKKLLALSNNPNENEAKAALLKARSLMAKYKISDKQINSLKEDSKVITKKTGLFYTTLTDNFIPDLAGNIAENYCCVSLSSKIYGKKKREISLCGFEADVEVCECVLKYAYDFIKNRCKEQKKLLSDFPAAVIRRANNSYGVGFSLGLLEMFEKQNQTLSSETGIVLVTPKEVLDETSQYKYQDSSKFIDYGYNEFQQQGFDDGKNFVPNRSIEGAKLS